MECYICHQLVDRQEYTRHIGSHLAGNVVGTRPETSVSPPTFSYDTVGYDHHSTGLPAHSTPPRTSLGHDHPLRPVAPTPYDRFQSDELEHFLPQLVPPSDHQRAHFASSLSPARTTTVDRAPQQQVATEQSIQPNAFQLWLQNPTSDSPKYTIIDGQTSEPDSQLQEFIQAAEILRGTTKEEVVNIVNQFEGYSCSDKETCLELVRRIPIFPGLVAYTYTHLVTCRRRRWFSSDNRSDQVFELKQLVERWEKYDDTRCILSCDKIKDKLLRILRASEVSPEEHKCKCNSALLDGTMVLNYDILNLAALAALCITTSQEKGILDKRGVEAEKLVDLFHNLLEANVELNQEYRRYFLNALIMFSKGSGYCPPGIYLAKGAVSDLVSESQGGFGQVFKGRVDSLLVAVKVLQRDNRVPLFKYNKEICKEAIVQRHLHHPNCLPLYGTYNMPTDVMVALVSPWMDKGTLSKYLEDNPEANRTKLILDVVRGLDYLHSMKPHVAHRDIKPDNILITRKGHACLADFGLVSTFDADDHFHTAPSEAVMGGTWNYMAPEIFDAETKEARHNVNKRACDMYALGCTIYAAYTGRHPFHDMLRERVRTNVISGQRPKFPDGKISPDMWSFVENLWSPNASERLTAQSALAWMKVKAQEERLDTSLAPFGEEWEWRATHDKCLWSVSC